MKRNVAGTIPQRTIPLASCLALLHFLAACAGDSGGGASVADNSGCPAIAAPAASAEQQALLQPTGPAFSTTAPDSFRARFETSKGAFAIDVIRAWSPRGADRFYGLVRNGFYDGTRFFRVVPGFVVQFGMSGVPAIEKAWDDQKLPDDSVAHSNAPGTVTFATAGPASRTTQIFINLADNAQLDGMGFSPIGRIAEGMDVVNSLNSEYGEGPPQGAGPDQTCMAKGGNAYLRQNFARLDSTIHATIQP